MYNPVKVEELTRTAQAAFERKNYPEAVTLFEKAVKEIDAEAFPALNAEARNNLSVALLKNGEAQAALDQASGTDKIFAELRDSRRQAIALGNQAAALSAMGRNDEALESYQQSAELLKQIGDSELRSYVLREISVVQMKRGKQVESLFAMDAALETRKKLNWREALVKRLMGTVHRMMGTK
jgi:tetratricopeptide (TPR) repeat protein